MILWTFYHQLYPTILVITMLDGGGVSLVSTQLARACYRAVSRHGIKDRFDAQHEVFAQCLSFQHDAGEDANEVPELYICVKADTEFRRRSLVPGPQAHDAMFLNDVNANIQSQWQRRPYRNAVLDGDLVVRNEKTHNRRYWVWREFTRLRDWAYNERI